MTRRINLDQGSPSRRSDGPLTAVEVMATVATGSPAWRRDASCATGEHDPDLWWPPAGGRGLAATRARLAWEEGAYARGVCAGCPVLGDCRDAFLATHPTVDELEGIWAGLSGAELLAAAGRSEATRTPARVSPRDRPGGMPDTPLDALLDERGLSMTAAAQLAGLPVRTVSDWARGRAVATASRAKLLADALGVEVRQAFERVRPGPTPTHRQSPQWPQRGATRSGSGREVGEAVTR
jgi:hypothetical protein